MFTGFTALQSGIATVASLRSDRLAAASPLELQTKVRVDFTIYNHGDFQTKDTIKALC